MTKKTALYRHFDSEDNLLYVGVSHAILGRISSHKLHSKWFNKVSKIDLAWFEDRKTALHAEMLAIKTEKPLFNTYHNSEPTIPVKGWRGAESYVNKDGKRVVKLIPDLLPYLSDHFSRGNSLKRVPVLTPKKHGSKYATRLFRLFTTRPWVDEICSVDLATLMKVFEATSKAYAAFNNIKRKIIEPAIKEINQFSDITADYTLIKRGNKVVSVEFTYVFKNGVNVKGLLADLKKELR